MACFQPKLCRMATPRGKWRCASSERADVGKSSDPTSANCAAAGAASRSVTIRQMAAFMGSPVPEQPSTMRRGKRLNRTPRQRQEVAGEEVREWMDSLVSLQGSTRRICLPRNSDR